MKVKELIKILKDLKQDAEVVLSSDGEGNNFSPLADFGTGLYLPESTWSGEFFNNEDEVRESYEEVPKKIKEAVVLWPTN